MLRNYLTIAARALRRRPVLTSINILGLAVGLAACLLIGLWVQHELSYDRFHPSAENIVRIGLDGQIQDRTFYAAVTPAPLAEALTDDVPEVEVATRFIYRASGLLRVDERTLTEQRLVRADSLFLDVFDGFEVVRGDRTTALDHTDAIVLTASTAEALFGTTDVVGRTLEVGDAVQRVTAVMADVPDASHVHFDAITTHELSPEQASVWVGNNFRTYVRLRPDAARAAVQATLDDLVERHIAPQISQLMGQPFSELQAEGMRYAFFVQPMTDVHLHTGLDYEMEPGGSWGTVLTFAAIALFILALACINFMNLATARASERATEVGMRKALGAGRPQLAGQFLGEAVLTTALGTVLAAMLASLALPAFNQTAGTQLSLDVVLAPAPLVAGLGLVGLVGLAAGSYPAFVLSHFQPAAVLKSADRHAAGGHGTRLRQGLVVLQLAITIALVAGTFVVEQQFRFVQTKRLGLEKEQVIAVDRAWTLGEGQEAFVERVRQLPGVAAAAAGERLFDDATPNTVFVPDDAPMSDGFSIDFLDVDARFVETLGIEVVSGRSFDPDRPGDAQALLVNEAAAKAFGWTEAEGHRLRHSFDDGAESYPVIGIVRNFHYQSMRQAVQPLVLQLGDVNTLIYVRAEPGAAPQVLDGLRAAWADVKPSEPLPYAFLDQTYAALHRDVERAGRLFTVFAALAVLIACLGLFGLATYTAQRRTKEIGIRKAMGATTLQLTWLLNREVAVLVGIGFAVAAPVAYVSLRRWLEGFAYRIDLGAGVFVLAGVLALVVALGTVGVQAYRAACLDPTTALRAE